jgi:GTP:adenosylcobinamide-phosphate guanylyltransferase
MDAIVTAGGIPEPGEPLYPYTNGGSKALLDIAGKPMIQWVLDALDGANRVERVWIVGLPEPADLRCQKLAGYLPNQENMVENIRSGVQQILEINPKTQHVLTVSSDIPALQSDMVDWVVETTMQTDHDVYYNIISKQVMEKRFPSSKRSYIHLRGVEVCGGDMNVIRARTVTGNEELWRRLVDARKNALKQAALVGYDTLFLLLLRLLTIEGAEKRACKKLGITGRAILCPYAEVGMDVDKPHQLEILRADLERAAVA